MCVYVYDIIIIVSDSIGISSLKFYSNGQCQTKNFENLKYLLEVVVVRRKNGIVLSLSKYVLDLLSKTQMLGVTPCNVPMPTNLQLTKDGDLFDSNKSYIV